jgi:hypothetical protein
MNVQVSNPLLPTLQLSGSLVPTIHKHQAKPLTSLFKWTNNSHVLEHHCKRAYAHSAIRPRLHKLQRIFCCCCRPEKHDGGERIRPLAVSNLSHTMIGRGDVWNIKACMEGVPGLANDTKAVRLKLCSDQFIDMMAGRVG